MCVGVRCSLYPFSGIDSKCRYRYFIAVGGKICKCTRRCSRRIFMRIIRWQEPEAVREQTLRERMQTEGLRPYSWSNGPGVTYAVHSHSYEKVLYCVRGSIRFMLHDTTDKETEA